MQFEWNERKRVPALKNMVSIFLMPSEFLRLPMLLPHPPIATSRFFAIGMLQGRFVTVVYTLRSEAIRIISFRISRHEERRKYHALFGE
ncbi:MAG: BrnT family toxin [Methyloglobulus sp.]|nr:BrnT family toxin [Methyloglobulus sp.]